MNHRNALSADAQASLTSVGYNYGSFAKLRNLRTAIGTEDPSKIASAVADLQGHNGGINRKRRLQEAAMIAHGGTTPAAQVPSVVAERAKGERDRRQKAEAARDAKPTAGVTHVHMGGITVNAQPHHDEGTIADMVHRRFNESAQRQLSDGVYA